MRLKKEFRPFEFDITYTRWPFNREWHSTWIECEGCFYSFGHDMSGHCSHKANPREMFIRKFEESDELSRDSLNAISRQLRVILCDFLDRAQTVGFIKKHTENFEKKTAGTSPVTISVTRRTWIAKRAIIRPQPSYFALRAGREGSSWAPPF